MNRTLALSLTLISTSTAADFTVTNTNDSGAGSLRQAIIDANASAEDDTIIFDQSPGSPFLTPQTLTLFSNLPSMSSSGKITITGPVAISRRVTISGGNTQTIFNLSTNGHLVASHLNIINGESLFDGSGLNLGANSRAEISFCRFAGNQSRVGGAIRVNSGAHLSLRNCTFYQNTATGNGGAIVSGGTLTATNCTFSHNTSERNGGAISLSANSTSELTHCTISQNTCSTLGGLSNGGGIHCLHDISGASSLTLRNTIIAGNTDLDSQQNPDISQSQNNLIISRGNNFIGAIGQLAALNFPYPTSNPTDITGTNTSPADPEITFQDDGIHVSYRPNSLFSPIINMGNTGPFPAEQYGSPPTDQLGNPRNFLGISDIGAVEFSTAIIVSSLNDTNNPGTLRHAITQANATPGTAIIFDENIFSILPQTIPLTMGELVITEPTVIYAPPVGVTLQSDGSDRVLRVNTSSTHPINLTNLTLRNGNSNSSTTDAGTGGGIYVHGASTILNLSNVNIRFNTATTGAGLAASAAQCNIQGGLFSGNNASADGGAVHISTNATCTADQATFALNTATNRGAAFYVEGATLTLTRSTINENTTQGFGGGVNLNTGSTTTLQNCTIYKNRADRSGGGIFTVNTTSTTFTSCTVSDNRSDNDSNNNGFGGGIRSAGTGSPVLHHCLLAGNSDRSSTNNPDLSGNFTSNGYNLVGINTGAIMTATTGDQIGTAIKPIDPLLENFGKWGGPTSTLALRSDSPAINTGDPGSGLNFLSTDQRGLLRRATTTGADTPDIGAYEFQYEPYSFWANYAIQAPMSRHPNDDNDGDGITNAFEHVHGTRPDMFDANPMQRSYDSSNDAYIFTFPISRKTDPETIRSESSTTLNSWVFFTTGFTALGAPQDIHTQTGTITFSNVTEAENFFRLGVRNVQ